MSRYRLCVASLVCAIASFPIVGDRHPTGRAIAASGHPSPETMRAAYERGPISFEVNEGQFDPQVKFLGRGHDYRVAITDRELWMAGGEDVVRFQLVGSDAMKTTAEDELPGKANYFLGNNREKWITDVRTYAKVRQSGVYPGIDAVYYGNSERLEYDFIVAPGADPGRIHMTLEGATIAGIGDNGDLELRAKHGRLQHHAPVVYQVIDGEQVRIPARYVQQPENVIAFAIGGYDRTRPLVIDPSITYSSYVGGSGVSNANDVAVDSSGNVYITGYAPEGLPIVGGIPGFAGTAYDAFVVKLNAAGAPVFSTYLGGTGAEISLGLSVDPFGNVYIAGQTLSTNFPTLNAFQAAARPMPPGVDQQPDGFAAKLTPLGNNLVYSTYLSGTLGDNANSIAADPSGNAHIVGNTWATDFPVLNALKPTKSSDSGNSDAFIVKLAANGNAVYSTYWGGNSTDRLNRVVADAAGNAYAIGMSGSTNLTLVNPYHGQYSGGQVGAVVVKLATDGSSILYSTFFGGLGYTEGHSIALGPAGNIYIAGITAATDLPAVNAYQPNHRGGSYDMWVAKLNLAGSALDYSTYIGGTDNDYSTVDLAVDSLGQAIITGATRSGNFPLQNAVQTVSNAGANNTAPVLAKFTASGSGLVYSTYLGGPLIGYGGGGVGVAAEGTDKVAVVGWLDGGLLTTPDAFQPSPPGARTGFVIRLTEADLPCGYDIQPASRNASSSGGPNSFGVLANGSTCGWSATSNANWIQLTGATTGTGGGSVPYTVSFNPGVPRAGTITVADKMFTIFQSGTTQPGCSFNLSQSTATAPTAGVVGATVGVTTGAACAWTAGSNATWMTVTSSINNVGPGTVTYNVAPAAAGTIRTGTLLVAEQTFTMTQSPAPSITLQPVNATVLAGRNATFTVAGTGAPAPTYQWQFSTNGSSFTNVVNGGSYAGATTATLTVVSAPLSFSGYIYRCVLTFGSTQVTSNTATLTVRARPRPGPDFDGDGAADILWRHSSGANTVWLINGTQMVGAGSLPGADSQWFVAGTGDYNGDGRSDIVWRHTVQPSTIMWFMNGTQPPGTAIASGADPSWQIVGSGDYNGDGKADLAWRHPAGGVAIWLMNGAAITGGYNSTVDASWQIVASGDYNGDGKSDILWRDTSGALAMWLMNGSSILSGLGIGTTPSAWQIVGAGDYNGDRKSDILWRHTSGEVAVWLMDSGTIIGGGGGGAPDTAWTIVGSGDYNADGRSDVLWRHISGAVVVWFMNANSAFGGGTVATVDPAWQIVYTK